MERHLSLLYHRIALVGKPNADFLHSRGEYVLQQRYSPRFKWHLHLQNVTGRDLILIHPANDAKKELLGCIAPVTQHNGIGKGSESRKALAKLKVLVCPAFEQLEEVRIRIQ